jgi:hypothetical protein
MRKHRIEHVSTEPGHYVVSSHNTLTGWEHIFTFIKQGPVTDAELIEEAKNKLPKAVVFFEA